MIRKQFVKNVLPSMLAFAFTGVYAIVDGWFIGRNIGDAGLAAINIAYPLTALIQAVGTGIGMGGAVLVAICSGKGDERREGEYLGNTVWMLIAACAVSTVLLSFFYQPLLQFFGAEGKIMEYAQSYIKVIIYGATFQILSTGLVPIVRNYNGALIAMLSMIAGFATNVVLDWLFIVVLPYGTQGAAVATIIGQAVTVVPCVLFLLVKKKLFGFASWKPKFSTMRKILSVGLSPFGLTISPNIVIIIMNKGALIYGGSDAVACYAVISYIVCIIQLLLQGIGDGSQPLIGRYHGAGEVKTVRRVRRMAYLYSFVTAAVCMVGMYFSRDIVPEFFGVSKQVAKSVSEALPIFILGFLFAAFLRITTSYFYAIKQNGPAYILIYGEPLLLALLVTFVLPNFAGITGVWVAVPLTQACLAVVGVLLLARQRSQLKLAAQKQAVCIE